MPETDFSVHFSDRQDAGADDHDPMVVGHDCHFGCGCETAKNEKEAVMLVLSRRESEKVLFPKLGVSVEIVKTQGKTVRLGIDAPRDVRVIRAELADDCDLAKFDPSPRHLPVSCRCDTGTRSHLAIEEQLDAAILAIHLAKNQLRQGLNVHAEHAIDDALCFLQSLEETLSMDIPAVHPDTLVRESLTHYTTRKKSTERAWREEKLLMSQNSVPVPKSGYKVMGRSDDFVIKYVQLATMRAPFQNAYKPTNYSENTVSRNPVSQAV